MDQATHLRRNPDLIAEEMDGDIVVLDTKAGRYFGLDVVGSHVWRMLEQPKSVGALIESVRQTFNVSPEDDVEGDTLAFLQEVLDQGLIQQIDP